MGFKEIVRDAAQQTHKRLGCISCATWRLYTPYWEKGAYRWMSPMDTDGLLVTERKADGGTPTGAPGPNVRVPMLLMGVAIQVEEATGHTKPNPFGKASVVNVPLGLWVDIYDENGIRVRSRLDHVSVLFVTRDDLPGVHSNLEVVTITNRDSWYIKFPAATPMEEIAQKIESDVRSFLKGRGRPKKLQ